MHTASALIVVTLLLFSFSYLSNALQCYRCRTTKNKGDKGYNAACIKPTKDQAQAREQPEAPLLLETCSPPKQGEKTFCYKNTDEKLASLLYIKRGCFNTKHYPESTCFDGIPKDGGDFYGKTCLCDKDLCNGEGSDASPSALLLSPKVWVLAQFSTVLRLFRLISV